MPGVHDDWSKITIKKRLTSGAFLLLGLLVWLIWSQPNSPTDTQLHELYQKQISGVMVQFDAIVVRLLPDDNQGSRHQKMIVKNGPQTVLIAHNIDLAPRVPVKVGDPLSILGEYQWNDQGGLVHWTHHDPQKRHPGGWIERAGKKFK